MSAIDKILELVEESGLTAKEYAINAGLGAGNITDWKTGRSKPSVESLQKIAKYANTTLEWLVGISYFKNSMEHANLIGYATGAIAVISKEECYMLEDFINLLLNSSKENLEAKILEVANAFKGYDTQKLVGLINTLYHDYIENKDMYKAMYNTNNFSIIAFLKYSSIRYAIDNTNAKNNILHKISLLEGNTSKAVNKKKDILFNIPILGKIAAGEPILAEQYIEGYLPMDPNIYGMNSPEDYFYLRVSGESMNLKIHNGDYALVHKQDYAENGDIVVAIVNGDDEATLKRYKRINEEIIMLEPMSTLPMEPIVINLKETKFKIIGKAIGQFGKF